MPKRSKWEQFQREMLAAVLMSILLAVVLLCTGCGRVKQALAPAERYQAGQNYGDSGATPCYDCPGRASINQPKKWLKPCQ